MPDVMLELILGIGVPVPIEQTTIKLINERPPAIVQVVEPTLDEKIKSNYYKCNTDIQWIRADNAQCKDKSTTVVKKPAQTARNSSVSVNGNSYTPGQCTWFVANRRYVPNGWGNASNWKYAAQSAGWTVSKTPVAGAIGWTSGHVVYVESVGDGVVVISDMNYNWTPYATRTTTMPITNYWYLY